MREGNCMLPAQGKFSILNYGTSGSGKTYFCTTMPKPYLVVTEREPKGMAAHGKDIPYVKVETYDELRTVLDQIVSGTRAQNAESICLDSLSDMTPLVIDMLLRQHSKPRMTLELWGIAVDHLRTFIRRFLTEVTKRAYVCVTALDIIDKDELTGQIIGMPSTIGQFKTQVGALFDIVLHAKQEMVWNTAKNLSEPKHFISSVKDGFFPAKDGIGFLAPVEENDFAQLLAKYNAKKETFSHLVLEPTT